jgi:polyisoprenoid-binding protein YceI
MNQVDPTTSPSPGLVDPGGVWQLDPLATSVAFDTKAMWFLKVHGTIPAVEGTAVVGPDGQITEGRLVLDPARIDTGNAKRDAHLLTGDFFDTEKYPTITFAAGRVSPIGGQVDHGMVDIDGKLTIGEATRPFAIRAEVRRDGDVATVTSTFQLDRRDWGLLWSKMGAGVLNDVRIEATFRRGASH